VVGVQVVAELVVVREAQLALRALVHSHAVSVAPCAAVAYAVIYRWRLRPGYEEQFAAAWRRVTLAIHDQCGSYGSRLHQAADGTWVAYARWPSAEARAACFAAGSPDPEGSRLMREAVEEAYDDVELTVADDLLREPS
jgi:heme-degrading monooxygenase HmoA